jgi:hypothetical protein
MSLTDRSIPGNRRLEGNQGRILWTYPQSAVAAGVRSLQQVVSGVVSVRVLLDPRVDQPLFVFLSHAENHRQGDRQHNHRWRHHRHDELVDLIDATFIGKFSFQRRQHREASIVTVVAGTAFHVVHESTDFALLLAVVEVPNAVHWQVLRLRGAAPRHSLVAFRVSDARLPAGHGVVADAVVGRVVPAFRVLADVTFVPVEGGKFTIRSEQAPLELHAIHNLQLKRQLDRNFSMKSCGKCAIE